jgi:hypothetical protein
MGSFESDIGRWGWRLSGILVVFLGFRRTLHCTALR